MRTVKAIVVAVMLCLVLGAARADEPAVESPSKRYVVRLQHRDGATFPVIILRDTQSGRESEIFDYDSVGQGTTGLEALWSPDSVHLALTIVVGPSTQEVQLYRIAEGQAREIEIPPVPKAFDTKKYSHRGGTYADRWEGSRVLWIGDSSKNRRFRYRFTKNDKLVVDAFKDDAPQ